MVRSEISSEIRKLLNTVGRIKDEVEAARRADYDDPDFRKRNARWHHQGKVGSCPSGHTSELVMKYGVDSMFALWDTAFGDFMRQQQTVVTMLACGCVFASKIAPLVEKLEGAVGEYLNTAATIPATLFHPEPYRVGGDEWETEEPFLPSAEGATSIFDAVKRLRVYAGPDDPERAHSGNNEAKAAEKTKRTGSPLDGRSKKQRDEAAERFLLKNWYRERKITDAELGGVLGCPKAAAARTPSKRAYNKWWKERYGCKRSMFGNGRKPKLVRDVDLLALIAEQKEDAARNKVEEYAW